MAKKLSVKEIRVAHHYFISEGIDKAAVQAEANRSAFDRRTSNDSVIHPHAYDDITGTMCGDLSDGNHMYYRRGEGLLK